MITRANAAFDVLNTEGGGTPVGYGTLCQFTCRGRYRWPRGLRRGSAATRLMGLRVRIQPGCLSVVNVVLSGRGLCDGPITRPQASYRVFCVCECDREASIMRRPWPTRGLLRHGGWGD